MPVNVSAVTDRLERANHNCQPAMLYDTLKEFSDDELDTLLALLTALEFGQYHCNGLATRYDKTSASCLGFVHIAAAHRWTKQFVDRA